MERFVYHPISRLRHHVLCSSSSRSSNNKRVIEKMDPIVRNALVTTIQDELNCSDTMNNNNCTATISQQQQHHNSEGYDDDDDDADGDGDDDIEQHKQGESTNHNNTTKVVLQKLDNEIIQLQQQLQDSDAKEQFIGVRLYKYQKLLQQEYEKITILKQQQQKKKKQQQRDNSIGNIAQNVELQSPIESNKEIELTPIITTTTALVNNDVETGIGDSCATTTTTEVCTDPVEGLTTKENVDNNNDDDINNNTNNIDMDYQIQKYEQNKLLLQQIQGTHKSIVITCETIRRKLQQLQQKRTSIQKIQDECDTFLHYANNNNNNNNNTTNTVTTTTGNDAVVSTTEGPIAVG